MKLFDRLHCPNCKGRLLAVSNETLGCSDCQRTVRIVDGIVDFVGEDSSDGSYDDYRGNPHWLEADADAFIVRLKTAAGDRWPSFLGDMMEFGCGPGETTRALAAGQKFRSLLVLDTELAMLQACRTRMASLEPGSDRTIDFTVLNGERDALGDAVVDTVVGTGLLSGIGDVRAFLTMVHRVLKPGGRAFFVVPNRRYHQAMCLAMAEAMVQRRARDGAWPEGQNVALEFLSRIRRILVHRNNPNFLSGLDEKHLFDSEALEDLGGQVGFATAEMIPLNPDPAGAETTRVICRQAGALDSFTATFGALTAAVGQPFFSLLSRQDQSASMLLWLTKGAGPSVRVFTYHAPTPPVGPMEADTALGGVAPRWSVELLARATPDGIVVTVGGWCLCNIDVQWVRLTLDDVAGHAPVWRPRPDVYEVLNRNGVYHPVNTLCSGIASELSFDGVHASDNSCAFRLEIVLASGVVVSGPAPERLLLDEPIIIAH